MERVEGSYRKLDILANNAGIAMHKDNP